MQTPKKAELIPEQMKAYVTSRKKIIAEHNKSYATTL